jgi:hypothetical protein
MASQILLEVALEGVEGLGHFPLVGPLVPASHHLQALHADVGGDAYGVVFVFFDVGLFGEDLNLEIMLPK